MTVMFMCPCLIHLFFFWVVRRGGLTASFVEGTENEKEIWCRSMETQFMSLFVAVKDTLNPQRFIVYRTC